jgi:hypothetical protein
MQEEPKRETNHDGKNQTDAIFYKHRFLPPFDGGDDRRAAMRTRPCMVADLSAAFVTLDEGHNLQ